MTRALLGLGVFVALGCASTPAADPPPLVVSDVAWSAWTARSRDALQRLIAVDTALPRGARSSAPKELQAFLRRESVDAQLIPVGRGRVAVWGRVEAVDARGPPVVLISHLDTPTINATAWPASTPPLALTVRDGAMWGAGLTGGKGLSVLHAASLAVLASVGGPRARDVHMVALPDGLDLGARSLSDVIAAVPSLATATVAISGGGFDVVDWFGDGRTVQAVAVGERATAILQVAALTRSDGAGPRASERLSRALVAVQRAEHKPRLTDTNRALLLAAADGLTLPQRWLIRSSLGAKLFFVPEFIDQPGLAGQFVDEVRTLRISAGRLGGTTAPHRSRAFLRARLLEDTTPGSIRRWLRRVVSDPDVHITVREASPLSTSGTGRDTAPWIARIKASASPGSDAVTVPILADGPLGCDPLRNVGVPVVGYAPFLRRPDDLAEDRPAPLSEDAFRRAVQRMATLVANLSAR